MLTIQVPEGEKHHLPDITEVIRTRRVNGEKTLEFPVIPTENNAHAFELLDTEVRTTFQGEPYIIKNSQEKDAGDKTVKSTEAVHTFFNTMINSFQYGQWSGSQQFQVAIDRVFGPTPYSYVITGSFGAQSFENFGRDNCLSLFKNVLDRYGAEFRIVGNTVYLQHEIGARTGFQMRWKHNVKAIDKQTETESFATVIRGFGGTPNENGVYPIQEEHRSSPEKIAIHGELHAPAVYDERITTVTGMKERLKKSLIDEPQLSITVDIAEVDGEIKNEGDYGYIIYGPMKIKYEARVVEIKEIFRFIDRKWKIVGTAVTLSNLRNKLTDTTTRFANTSKRVDRLMGGQDKLPFSAVDEAIANATRALQNAQTELEFNNGIIARDKTDANKLVLFNSEGLGTSRDGGQNFDNAITGDGVVAEAIFGKYIYGVNIASQSGESSLWIEGGDVRLTSLSNGRNLNLNPLGMTGFNDAGDILFQANRTWVTSGILGTNTTNVYLASSTGGEARIVDIEGIPGDGLVGSYNYKNLRASGIYANFVNVNSGGSAAVNLYMRPLSTGEVRVTANGTTDIYRSLRASGILANTLDLNTMFGVSSNLFVRPANDGEIRVTATGTTDNYRPVRASGYYGAFYDVNSTGSAVNVYLRPLSDGEARITATGTTDLYRDLRLRNIITNGVTLNTAFGASQNLFLRTQNEVRVVAVGSNDDSYLPVRASEFITASSEMYKDNIEEWNVDALALIKANKQFKWNPKSNPDITNYGDVVEYEGTPAEIKMGDGISGASKTAMLWLGMQKLIKEVEEIKQAIQ